LRYFPQIVGEVGPAVVAAAASKAEVTDVIPKWKPSTVYTAGFRVVAPHGIVVTALADFTSGSTYSDANWRAGTPTTGVPVVKQAGDARAAVWEYTHAAAFGYLYHLLAGGSFADGAAIIAIGLDSTAGGTGVLIANKSKSAGITINQQPSISADTAYGIKITGQTALAPSIRLEQNVNGAADALQIVTFGTPTATQHGLFIADPSGAAWATYPIDGRLEGARDLRIRDKNTTVRSIIGVSENGAYPWGDVAAKTAQISKDSVTWYSPSGGGSLWSYAWIATGSGFTLATGGAGAFGAVPSNPVISVKNNQIAFLGASAISKRPATADATDLASAITAVNALKADIIAFGLKATL
jgi:hypothetical protein